MVSAAALIDTTLALPSVRGPVLSMTREYTRARDSMALPPLIRMPYLAARERPDTIATGTARMRGHGVATTRTATARTGSTVQYQARPEIRTVIARNSIAKRSASLDIGAFERCASSTRRTMPAYVLSAA